MGCFTVISFCFIRGNKHFTSEGVKGHFTKNVLSINLIRASCWWLNGLEVNLFLMLLFDLQHQRSIKTSPDEFWWAAPGSIQVAVKSWVHPSVTQYSCSTDLSIKLHVFTLSCSVLLLCYQITAASQVLAGRLCGDIVQPESGDVMCLETCWLRLKETVSILQLQTQHHPHPHKFSITVDMWAHGHKEHSSDVLQPVAWEIL